MDSQHLDGVPALQHHLDLGHLDQHGIALRDYLVVTRSIDPVELEQLRLEQVTRGFSPGQNQQVEADLFADSLFDSVIYVTFQELATRVSDRNTGKACNETVADQLLQRNTGPS